SSSQPPQHFVARDLTQLHEVLADLAPTELRLAELPVAEDVGHLDRLRVPATRHHLEADLEADRVQLDTVDHGAPHCEETRGRIADRHEHVPHDARDARHD